MKIVELKNELSILIDHLNSCYKDDEIIIDDTASEVIDVLQYITNQTKHEVKNEYKNKLI